MSIRLAMALIEGAKNSLDDRRIAEHTNRLSAFVRRATGTLPVPDTDDELLERFQRLARQIDRRIAEQLPLLLEIDERQLWRHTGCRNVVHWMDTTLGICRSTGLERLRVARALRKLPLIEAQFGLARLSWSKVRVLTRVASEENEQELLAAALDLSVSETDELCRRWYLDVEESADYEFSGSDAHEAESRRAHEAWVRRSVRWRSLDPCTTRITIDLPNEQAAEYLKVVEAMEDELQEVESERPSEGNEGERGEHEPERESPDTAAPPTATQRRADAVMLMARKALAHSGDAVASADRYRVFVHLDARLLGETPAECDLLFGAPPVERPIIPGFSSIAVSTARRLASQARLTVVAEDADGEVVASGQDARLFSPQTVRAISARDRTCQMPGCANTRWLQTHHVVPWAEGGETTVRNGALICSGCHRKLHECGFRLDRVDAESIALDENLAATMTKREQAAARAKIAAVQRFRLVDADGKQIAGPKCREWWQHPHPVRAFDSVHCAVSPQVDTS